MKQPLIKAAPLAAIMALSAAPAQAVDYTFCDLNGNPYCDGISLNFNVPGLTVSGAHTGCLTGTAFGHIVYTLANPGVGATYAFGGGSAYTGDIMGDITFAPPYPWRLTDQGGNPRNNGIMCAGLPANSNTGASSAGGI